MNKSLSSAKLIRIPFLSHHQRWTFKLMALCLLLVSTHSSWAQGGDAAIPKEYTLKGVDTNASENVNSLAQQYQLFLATAAVPDQFTIGYVEMKLKHTLNSLEAEKLQKKKLDKQVELISSTLTSNFLKVYFKDATFEQLFREGAYNEYSFAAIWSLVLSHFDIPHQIVQETKQVYLLVGALPNQQEIRSPTYQKKDLPPTEHLHEYAYSLKALGLLSAEEFSQKSSEAIFSEYFHLKKEVISPYQLAGLMYYEQAGKQYLEKNYTGVLKSLEAARDLYQMPRYQALRSASLMQIASDSEVVGDDELITLFEFYKKHPIPEIKTEIVKRFLRLSNKLLETEETQDKQLQLYLQFKKHTAKDVGLEAQLAEIHYLQMAKSFAQSFHTLGVLNYMDSLYLKRPTDKAIQNILAVLLVRSLGNDRDFQKGLSVLKVYRKKYPFLGKMPLFKDLELFYQAEQAHYHFARNEINLARKSLLQFERSLVKLGQTPRVNIWLTTVYTSAADYFIRNGEQREAMKMIQRGLSLYPKSDYFQHRFDLLR